MDRLIQPELGLGTCRVRKNVVLKLTFTGDLLFPIICLFHMHLMKIGCVWEGSTYNSEPTV